MYLSLYCHLHVYFFFSFLQYSYEVGTINMFSDDNTEAQRSYVSCSRSPMKQLEFDLQEIQTPHGLRNCAIMSSRQLILPLLKKACVLPTHCLGLNTSFS